MKCGEQADSQRGSQVGGIQGPGAMGLSLSSVSVEVMKTESGYDSTTSSRELMPLIRASKWGDALVCKLQLNKVVFFKKKKKNQTHPTLCPSDASSLCSLW